jgi:NACalpha-BTF3-like transcription factor
MKLHTKRKENVIMATDNDANVLIEKDIILVMFQTGTTREKAIAALLENDGDIVNAIMYI